MAHGKGICPFSIGRNSEWGDREKCIKDECEIWVKEHDVKLPLSTVKAGGYCGLMG